MGHKLKHKHTHKSTGANRLHDADAGVWATLQFKWVQLQYPVVVVAFEKLLLGGCLPVAATVQAWGVIAALGLAAAPFCLGPILAVLYCLFAMPLPSSFATGSRSKSIGQLCTCLCHHCIKQLCMCHPSHVSCMHACTTLACVTSACISLLCTAVLSTKSLCHTSVKCSPPLCSANGRQMVL